MKCLRISELVLVFAPAACAASTRAGAEWLAGINSRNLVTTTAMGRLREITVATRFTKLLHAHLAGQTESAD